MTGEQTRNSPERTGIRPPKPDKVFFGAAIFLCGGLFGSLGVAPFPTLKQGWDDTVRLISELRQTRPTILEPSPYDGSGVVSYDADLAQPGYTLIQGLLPGGAQVRMIDMEGNEVQRWTIDYFDIWTDPDHVVPAGNVPKSEFNYHTQGFWPLSDGSIVVNVSGIGAVRLDRCSQPVWRLDRMAHHSVTPTSDGKFWIPGHISVFETPERLLPRGVGAEQIADALVGTLKNYNNSLMLVNADGDVEREFSALKAITDARLEGALYASLTEIAADPTHVNDIELVTPALSSKIDEVVTGDLLVSIREMNMLAIFDQTDGHLKWHKQGPWTRQHDPDVMPDGTIEIFNNRSKAIGDWVEGSQILSYDPATDETTVIHPTSDEDSFDSWIMGTHQRLDNGNMLITETMAGRAFEVTPDGTVVWDYRLPYDAETASLFEAGLRLPADYFEIENWTCEENNHAS